MPIKIIEADAMSKRIYADHATTTPLMPKALEAMLPFSKNDVGNPSSLHGWTDLVNKAIAEARATIAECINAEPEEIFFTSGGTEANEWVIKGSSGGILTSSYEHHAILNAVASEADKGREVVSVRPKVGSGGGYIMPARLSKVWKDGIGLVSVMMANHEIGTINPIHLLSEFAHKQGALFHTDAVQAVGHIPIDVQEAGVDFLSASAHKFNGPKGVGFLYIRKGLKLEPLLKGGLQENGLQAETENVASIVGMATALKVNCERMNRNMLHLVNLTVCLCEGIDRIFPNAIYLGDGCMGQLPGFISVSFPGHSSEDVVQKLDLKGVTVSSGVVGNSKKTKMSHVLKAINATNAIGFSTIRITLGIENTLADVEGILKALRVALR